MANVQLVHEAWPTVEQQFSEIGETSDYRTFYARISSQIHSYAEETLRHLLHQISDDTTLRDRMVWDLSQIFSSPKSQLFTG